MNIYEMLEHLKDDVKKEILKCNPQFDIVDIYSYGDGNCQIETKKYINSFLYKEDRILEVDEDIQQFVIAINSHYNYIQDLWEKYPKYCKTNECLQHYRNVFIDGVGTIRLTGMLELPNTTECSCGGGDYEIKRTPERMNEFIENIDKYTLILSQSITKLQRIKADFLEHINND